MNSLIKRTHSEYWLLAMFPIYFDMHGIFKTTDSIHGGLTVPLSFYAGILIFFLIIGIFFYRGLYISKEISIVLYYYFFSLVFCLLGIAVTGQITAIIPFLQFVSGFFGVIIAYWCFAVKKIDFGRAAYIVSILYLVLIILNIFEAWRTTGLARFLDRFTNAPGTPFWSILQPWVYYPYLVAMVFLFAIPYWKKKCNPVVFYCMYGGIFVYIALFQVRGAILTYLVGFLGYILFFLTSKPEKYSIISLMAILAAALTFIKKIPLYRIVSLFDTSLFTTLGGRDYLYEAFYNNLVSSSTYLLTGSLFKSKGGLVNTTGIFAEVRIDSFHNFYLELIDLGGILMLLGFVFCIIAIIRTGYKGKNIDTRFCYWTYLIVVEAIIDLNINVPLRNTNPAIVYWFYWAGCAICASKLCKSFSASIYCST